MVESSDSPGASREEVSDEVRNEAEESRLLLQSTLDALELHIAVLDEAGTILTTNRAWQLLAEEGGVASLGSSTCAWMSCGPGENYLRACDEACDEARGEALGAGWEAARSVARGIRSVASGEAGSFALEYSCGAAAGSEAGTSAGERWFRVRVTGFDGALPVRVVVAHEEITARREAQADRLYYEATARSSEDAFISMAPDGTITRWNQGAEKMLGYSSGEAIGKPYALLVPEGSREQHEEAERSLAKGRDFLLEGSLVRKGGHEVAVSVRLSLVSDSGGQVLGRCAIARDISERKRAEAQLQSANEALEGRVGQRTQELARSNRALHAQIIERQMAMGALKDVVTQLEASKAQSEQANAELRANEQRLIEGNRAFTELARLRASTQGELENALARITQASSEILGVERCSVWLAEEHQGEESLLLLDLYESSKRRHTRGDRILRSDYPAYFAALETGSVLAQDARSHPATRELIEGTMATLNVGAMMDVAVVNEGKLTGAICHEHCGGPRAWKIEDQTFAGSAAALYALALEARALARTDQALRHAKEEAEQARREAEGANAAKSEFLSRMSHELRTPLNAILGFGQILEMEGLAGKQGEGVRHILRAGEHLLALINEVLDISRIEAGKMALSVEPTPLASTVSAVLDLARPLADKGHVLLLDETQAHPWHVMADSQRLRQALLNLVSNAIKYNRPGGHVLVSATTISTATEAISGEHKLRISVQDTGAGLREHEVARLFTPFERLGAAHTRIEGTGIGLALSKRLVEVMGGTIGASSTWGQGSTFWIELPLAPSPLQALQGQLAQGLEPQPSTSPRASVRSGARGRAGGGAARLRKTVLYIEDNRANLQLVEVLLEPLEGVRLLTASQGEAGLELSFEHGPELILLDLHLPDMDGDAVLGRLQSNALTGHIPVIMLSADATPGQAERLIAAGASAYLTKPLDVRQFLQIVEDTLYKT